MTSQPISDFSELELIEPLQRAVAHEGYTTPTPIQAGAIPLLLEGRDVLGCAQTGTGKTAAFALPILQFLAQGEPELAAPEAGGPEAGGPEPAAPEPAAPEPAEPRGRQRGGRQAGRRGARQARRQGKRRGKRRIKTLVLSPTRELAAQIGESFKAYGRYLDFRHQVIFGGVSQVPQVDALRRGVDVLVATPGRLLDLQGQGYIQLDEVEFFVLDEADRMLDMGFIHDIRRVLRLLPDRRQNLLFSATLPPDITKLASSFLHDPARVEVTPPATTVELIDQCVMFVRRPDKRRLLAELLRTPALDRALVFTRTKHGANRLVKQLDRAGIGAAAIHGNKSQGARTRALDGFRRGTLPVLVATDVASRGIDVDGISHVFNFDLPNEPESYVHRIGRTGRAGHEGIAIAFCDETEGDYLRDIEQLIGEDIEVIEDQPYHYPAAIPPPRRRRGRPGMSGGGPRRGPARGPGGGSGRGPGGGSGRGRGPGGGQGRSRGSGGGPAQDRGPGQGSRGKRPRRSPAPGAAPPRQERRRAGGQDQGPGRGHDQGSGRGRSRHDEGGDGPRRDPRSRGPKRDPRAGAAQADGKSDGGQSRRSRRRRRKGSGGGSGASGGKTGRGRGA